MKFISVTGGLGNQMFIYAFYLNIRKRGQKATLFVPYRHDSKKYGKNGFELEKIFLLHDKKKIYTRIIVNLLKIYANLLRIFPAKYKDKLYRLIGIYTVSVPENFIYYPEVFVFNHKHELYKGTWQSELYFKEAINEIKESFVFKIELLSQTTKKIAEQIQKTNSISIHIRRGDYLNSQYSNGFAEICTPDYYRKAIEYISDRIKNPTFYIFTDEIEWVSQNFIIENSVYVQHNTDKDSWQDLYLMSLCQHNIIANSSFSWWGAWLNNNPEKIVVAPSKWWKQFEHDDVVPSNWIRI
ncbi:MAG: alpha-1,2-fucosyltransferase [Bacteroidales bacterium]|nr:alpha-1,2-fucosyltransferase [Bacteroidales bacterium]